MCGRIGDCKRKSSQFPLKCAREVASGYPARRLSWLFWRAAIVAARGGVCLGVGLSATASALVTAGCRTTSSASSASAHSKISGDLEAWRERRGHFPASARRAARRFRCADVAGVAGGRGHSVGGRGHSVGGKDKEGNLARQPGRRCSVAHGDVGRPEEKRVPRRLGRRTRIGGMGCVSSLLYCRTSAIQAVSRKKTSPLPQGALPVWRLRPLGASRSLFSRHCRRKTCRTACST